MIKPKGLFINFIGSKESQEVIKSNDECKGALVRVLWSDIQPSKDKFDFSKIEDQVKVVKEAGKQWSLTVLAGAEGTPKWVVDESVDKLIVTWRDKKVEMSAGWDESYLKNLEKVVAEVAAKYSSDELLSLVYVPQATVNGVEGHFNGNNPSNLKSQGFTSDKWIECSKKVVQIVADAFQDKAIAFEVHEVLNSAITPQTILEWAYKQYKGRVGAGMWWLSGKDGYQTSLLDVLKDFEGDVYCQPIGKSNQPARFEGGDFSSIYDQAKELGCEYIELWNWEFEQNSHPVHVKSFNKRVVKKKKK